MDQNMRELGRPIREAVPGETHGDDEMKDVDSFIQPIQNLLNEYCWGTVWGREGAPRKVYNMINFAKIIVMKRPQWIRAHLCVALNSGVTREEIREILVQVAVYHGMPAAVDSFRIARELFAELDEV